MVSKDENYDKIKEYITSDLGCACALSCLGFIPASLDRSNPRKVRFIFASSKSLIETVDAYWSRNLLIDALTYFEWLKVLKGRVFNG